MEQGNLDNNSTGRYIVAYDVETTGLSPKDDYIIQLAAVKFDRETFEIIESRNWYIRPANPHYVISPDAFKTHGISKEWLDENGVSMREVAPLFISFCSGCDVLTYNGNSFDIQFLCKDISEAGYEFPLEGRHFYDSYVIECKRHPRDLSTVYHNYTGEYFDDAHNALADVTATVKVFQHQMTSTDHTPLNESYDSIDDWDESNLVSPDGSIKRKKVFGVDTFVLSKGKYKDEDFLDVLKKDYGYCKWFMNNVASGYTRRILSEYYKTNREKINGK